MNKFTPRIGNNKKGPGRKPQDQKRNRARRRKSK
jgi:hypothetical protein